MRLIHTIVLSFLLCMPSAAQEMWNPEPILTTDSVLHLIAVELGTQETRVTFLLTSPSGSVESSPFTSIPAAAFASDEAAIRHPLLRNEQHGDSLILIFDALSQNTRLLDIEIPDGRRWVGIHSTLRALHLPTARPHFDEHAIVPDSIDAVLRANDLSAFLSSDAVYISIHRRLPLFRDYIAWKYHLTPHQVFLLQRSYEKRATSASFEEREKTLSPFPQKGERHPSLTGGTGSGASPRALSTLPRGPKPTRKELKRLSKFEQKMLQEQRRPNP